MRNIVQALLLVLAFMGLASVTWAATVPKAPESLPQSVQDAVPQDKLQLLGYGRFRKLLWDVFDASLWVPGEHWDMDKPFALELRYARDIEGEDIVDSTRDQLKHVGFDDPGLVNPWLERLKGIFPDVKEGDSLVGLHLPEAETRFYFNGQFIGAVADPTFGPAFFAIWLDQKSSEQDLRNALLGNGCRKPQTVASAEVKPCGGATMPESSTRRPGIRQP